MLTMAMTGRAPAPQIEAGSFARYAGRWPASPTAGVFLLVLGVSAVAGSFFDPAQYGRALALGFSAGALAAVLLAGRCRDLFGPTRPRERWFIAAAILFEAVGLGVAGQFAREIVLANCLLIASVVVALHFVIMGGAFGPRIAALGGAIIAWIAACAAVGLDLHAVLFGDGVLKAAFGAVMAWPAITGPYTRSR